MRSLIFVLVLLAGLRAAAASSIDSIRYDFKGIENFRRVFPDASIRQIDRKGDIVSVRFYWAEHELEAWFDGKGQLIATSGLIDSRVLPISIQMGLRREYEGFEVLQAREFYHLEKGLSYYLIVKKREKALILRADADGNLSVEKKLKEG